MEMKGTDILPGEAVSIVAVINRFTLTFHGTLLSYNDSKVLIDDRVKGPMWINWSVIAYISKEEAKSGTARP